LRAKKSQENYKKIGGGSPIRRITEAQAQALKLQLQQSGQEVNVYIGMRYWHPFTEEAIAQIKKDAIEELVILPLYPQFSISTTGSSLRLLDRLWQSDPQLQKIKYTVVPSWYDNAIYLQSMANLIAKTLDQVKNPQTAHVFFSAHGVPVSYIEEAGDPYRKEIETCAALIMKTLNRSNPYKLAYQSRVGPVEWLQPYTDNAIKELAQQGVKELVVVPISFVSEHIETLEEIDMEYREIAEHAGIETFARVPAPDTDPIFIQALADVFRQALGDRRISFSETIQPQKNTKFYPQERWEWGMTPSAEVWNGRLAMLGFLILLLELWLGRGQILN
jgi:ferrochelatase